MLLHEFDFFIYLKIQNNHKSFLSFRGRYDIKVYPSFIQLHGKTFDFKIPIETVERLFLMPHQDQRQHFFVVSIKHVTRTFDIPYSTF